VAKSAVLSAANNKHRLANQRMKRIFDRDCVFGCQKPCIMSCIPTRASELRLRCTITNAISIRLDLQFAVFARGGERHSRTIKERMLYEIRLMPFLSSEYNHHSWGGCRIFLMSAASQDGSRGNTCQGY